MADKGLLEIYVYCNGCGALLDVVMRDSALFVSPCEKCLAEKDSQIEELESLLDSKYACYDRYGHRIY